jgi:hypothetical protein
MLWGGLLMLVAVVLLLVGLGRQARTVGAIAGGAGFGTFIDELGKFITSDNDYFFRPAVGIVYLIFVVLFLVTRTLGGRTPRTREAALANAADSLPDLVLGGATEAEQTRVLRLLEQSGERGPLASAIRAFVAAAPAAAAVRPSLVSRMAARGREIYEGLIASRWFGKVVVVLFVGSAIGGALTILLLGIGAIAALAAGEGQTALAAVGEEAARQGWPVFVVSLVAAGATVFCSIAGAITLRRSRLTGLQWFHRGVLISLFLTQPINFVDEQFWALADLAFDLLLWIGVNYLIRQETLRLEALRAGQEERRAGAPAVVPVASVTAAPPPG